MKFSGKALLTVAVSLYLGLAAAATEAETFLAENPDVQVGREALEKAEANMGPNTFGIVNKPASNIVLVQEFDADTNERIFAVALIDDEKAEKYYKDNNKDGDIKGQVMKRYDTSAEPDKKKCGRAVDANEPSFIFERAPRCGQFCSRSPSCTGDRNCPSCRYVGGRCRHQLSCQRR
ncbi:hypothetical protein QQS21_004364 [Conoideocrella luteorostrata]|uniref:Uncharacterized protein n=1 Tax=Conoideocrella luteorostrata TaxID=1105319 RepID=A0AAJ0FUQ1_9HYPO|nr:hypothetical protein QQS21_004364 [Conoideocrella luteorostrata]